MAKFKKILPVLLYFYQGELSQSDAEKVVEHFDDKDVRFRRVIDVNDTRDIIEKCAYASGTVPIIYSLRKAPEVLTDGILSDPLGQGNSAKPTSKGKDDEAGKDVAVDVTTTHVQPSDANIAVKLAREEIATVTAKAPEVDVKVEDVKEDPKGSPASSVTGQTPVAPVASPVAPVASPVAPVVAPTTSPKK